MKNDYLIVFCFFIFLLLFTSSLYLFIIYHSVNVSILWSMIWYFMFCAFPIILLEIMSLCVLYFTKGS